MRQIQQCIDPGPYDFPCRNTFGEQEDGDLAQTRVTLRRLAEVRRVLRPGGQFLFLEHVLSETDQGLADAQIKFTPFQVQATDGCHLDRRTLQNIKAAAFKSVDSEYFDLDGFLYLNPTIAGIATV